MSLKFVYEFTIGLIKYIHLYRLSLLTFSYEVAKEIITLLASAFEKLGAKLNMA